MKTVMPPTANPRSALFRRLAWLAAATIALVLFILILGDVRRQNVAMVRAREYADELNKRLGAEKLLPLNLEPADTAAASTGKFRFEWLTRDQAFRLRGAPGPLMVAHTVPISADIVRDGRAVILFDNDQFSVLWVRAARFSEMKRTLDARLASAPARD